MAGITLKLEGLNQLQKMVEFTNPKNFAKAQLAGLVKATSAAKTQAAKGIGERYSIKAARIKEDISSATIAPDGSFAAIRFSRIPPTISQFGMKPGSRGGPQPGLGRGQGWGKPSKPGQSLSAIVLRSRGRKKIRGAFVITIKSDNEVEDGEVKLHQLVVRKDSKGKLHAVYGPSVGSLFLGKGRYSQELQINTARMINQEFVKGFQKKLNDIARGYGGK